MNDVEILTGVESKLVAQRQRNQPDARLMARDL
jgi:hypothetical protein